MITHLLTCPNVPAPIKTLGEYDFMIAVAICITIVIVAFLAILGFLIWKWIDVRAKEKQNSQRREEEVKDKNRKERSDLLDKKLEILKSNDAEKYISAIDSAIEEIK